VKVIKVFSYKAEVLSFQEWVKVADLVWVELVSWDWDSFLTGFPLKRSPQPVASF